MMALGSLRSDPRTGFRANPRVHIMHNVDDPLAEPAALGELSQAMGSRMTLYPYGGTSATSGTPTTGKTIRGSSRPRWSAWLRHPWTARPRRAGRRSNAWTRTED